MHSNSYTLVIAAVLAVYLLLDTSIILRTGHVPGLFRGRLHPRLPRGPTRRESQPRRFWVYVSGNLAVLLLAVSYIVAALIFDWR